MSKKVLFHATGRDIHVDVPLSNVAIDYTPTGFIAESVMPIVSVAKQSDRMVVFDRAEIFRTEEDRRAPGTEANKIRRSVSSLTYFADNYALKHGVTIEDRENADPIYRQKLYNEAGEYVSGKLKMNWEKRVVNLVTSGSNVGSFSAVGSAWTDATNSDPLADVNQGIDIVYDSTGTRPNKIVFGELAWRNFRRSDIVRNLIFGTNNGGGFANLDGVRALLDIETILVGAAYSNDAAEGQAEDLNQLWGDNVLVYFTPNAPSINEPSFAYSHRWTLPAIPNMQAERHPYDSKTKTEEVEVGYYQDEKIVGADYAYLITNVTSST